MPRRMLSTAFAVALVAGLVGAPHAARATAPFLVGAAAEPLDPTQALIASGRFYLGGFGLGSGTVGVGPAQVPVVPGRVATGVMQDPFGPWVRAIAISDGSHAVAIVDLDNQGMFAGYKPNPNTGALRPYGIDDIRAAVEDARPGLPSDNIVISSSHSHAGQDLTGVWGLVPDDYFAFVKAQAVKAITGAYDRLRPAILRESSVHTPDPCEPSPPPGDRIFNNQMDCSVAVLSRVDSDVRVLRAFPPADPDGRGAPIAVLVNAAIHSTVMGSGNRLVSGDWPSTVARYIERRHGGATVAVATEADVGRTQPNRSDCTAAELASGLFDVDQRAPGESCKLSKYAKRVLAWVDVAIAGETPVTAPGVAAVNLFIRDPSHSVILFSLNYAGDAAGAPIARAITPPYLSGAVIGTWVSALRVGDILMLTAPGEAYPNIRFGVMDAVSGQRRTWTHGLAGDQLGYLIAPFPEGFPEPIRRSFFGGNPNDPATWTVKPVDNDNYFFTVSHTLGDHVMCTSIKGAGLVGFATHDVPAKCAPWMAEPNVSGPGDPSWDPPV